MMAKKHASPNGTPALRILEGLAIVHAVHEYEHSRTMDHGYALDTAAVLGVDPESVFKTLMVEAGGHPAVGVVQATRMLSLKRLAKALGAKHAQMMDPAKAERLTGYVTGGISPLGQKTLYPTVIDEEAYFLDSMLVSGGKRTLSVSIAPEDLANALNAQFAPISGE